MQSYTQEAGGINQLYRTSSVSESSDSTESRGTSGGQKGQWEQRRRPLELIALISTAIYIAFWYHDWLVPSRDPAHQPSINT